MIGILTVVSSSSVAYLTMAHTITFFALVCFAHCKPYVEPEIDRLQVNCFCIV